MAVTQVQHGESFDGSHTWASTPIAGNLLTIRATQTGGSLFTAPAGWQTISSISSFGAFVALFYRIADGTETSHTVGGAGGSDRFQFDEWSPGVGRQWPADPVDTRIASAQASTGTSAVLSSIPYSGDGVAILAHAPNAATSGESVNGGYTMDFEAIRLAAYQIVSGSGTVPTTTVSWTTSVGYGTVHSVLVTDPVATGFDGSYVYDAAAARRRVRDDSGLKASLRIATGERLEV